MHNLINTFPQQDKQERNHIRPMENERKEEKQTIVGNGIEELQLTMEGIIKHTGKCKW